MIVTGGRSRNLTNIIATEVYDTETSKWYWFPGLSLYRHISFNKENELYLYGGFKNSDQFKPLIHLEKVALYDYFKYEPALTTKIKNYLDSTHKAEKKKNSAIELNHKYDQKYRLARQAVVLKMDDTQFGGSLLGKLDIDQLENESKRIGQYKTVYTEPTSNFDELLIDQFIQVFMKPESWYSEEMDSIHAKIPFKRSKMLELCKEATKAVMRDETLVKVKSPVKVFGSIFGQYDDLMRMFSSYGNPSDLRRGDIHIYNYIFLGNLVDRGKYSLEVIFLLMALKVKYPGSVVLTRGCHEDYLLNRGLGLKHECLSRIPEETSDGKGSVFAAINNFFDSLPLAAVVDKKIFCVHGGIGSTITNLSDIAKIKRPVEVNHEAQNTEQQQIFDLLYSKYNDTVQDFSTVADKKGNITVFGVNRLKKFLYENGLQMVITANQLTKEGFVKLNDNMVGVYSCTNYQGITRNKAGIAVIWKNSTEISPKTIEYEPTERKNWIDTKDVSF